MNIHMEMMELVWSADGNRTIIRLDIEVCTVILLHARPNEMEIEDEAATMLQINQFI